MINDFSQPHLFDRPSGHPVPPRQTFIDAALGRADSAWREAYSAFIVEWLASNGPAIAETIRLEYESRQHLPQLVTADKRASGGVFRALTKAGAIERTGTYGWSLERSSPMPYYRKK